MPESAIFDEYIFFNVMGYWVDSNKVFINGYL